MPTKTTTVLDSSNDDDDRSIDLLTDKQEMFLKQEMKAAFCELLGTAMLVFFGVGSVNATNMTGAIIKPIDYAFAFGLAITCLAYAFGAVSGGHMNPAVTLSMMVSRNITLTRGVFYIVAQFAGGIAGGALLWALCKDSSKGYIGGIGLDASISAGAGIGFEFMGTLLLLTVVFNVAVWTSKPLKEDLSGSTIAALAPLPIGFAVLVAHLVLGPFTGCGINPARVVGAIIFDETVMHVGVNETDIADGPTHTMKHLYIYFLGPFLASLVAPTIYYIMHGTVRPGSQQSVKVAPE